MIQTAERPRATVLDIPLDEMSLVKNTDFEKLVLSIHKDKQEKQLSEQTMQIKKEEELPMLKLVARILDVYKFMIDKLGMPYPRKVTVREIIAAEEVLKKRETFLRLLFKRVADLIFYFLNGYEHPWNRPHWALEMSLSEHIRRSRERGSGYYPPNLSELIGEMSKLSLVANKEET